MRLASPILLLLTLLELSALAAPPSYEKLSQLPPATAGGLRTGALSTNDFFVVGRSNSGAGNFTDLRASFENVRWPLDHLLQEPASPRFGLAQLPALLTYSNSIHFMSFGDSIAGTTTKSVFPSLMDYFVSLYGFGGYIHANYQNTALTGLAGSTSIIGPDANWWGPYFQIPAGSSYVVTNILSSSGFRGSTLQIYYLIGPSEGTWKIQIGTNGGAYADALSVNANTAGSTLLAVTNVAATFLNLVNYQFVGVSGTSHIVGQALYNADWGTQIIVSTLGGDGQNLTQLRSIPRASLDTFLTNANPNVVVYSMKETADTGLATFSNNIIWLESVWSNDLPNSTIIYLGPYTDSTDTNGYAGSTQQESDTLRDLANSYGRTFIDLEKNYSYPNALARGMMFDAVHENGLGTLLQSKYVVSELLPPVHAPAVSRGLTGADGGIKSRATIGPPAVTYPTGGALAFYDARDGIGVGTAVFGTPFNGVFGLGLNVASLSLNNVSLWGNGTDTGVQASTATGVVEFFNRNSGGSIANGVMGGFSTNGGFQVGDNAGAGTLDKSIPKGQVSANSLSVYNNSGAVPPGVWSNAFLFNRSVNFGFSNSPSLNSASFFAGIYNDYGSFVSERNSGFEGVLLSHNFMFSDGASGWRNFDTNKLGWIMKLGKAYDGTDSFSVQSAALSSSTTTERLKVDSSGVVSSSGGFIGTKSDQGTGVGAVSVPNASALYVNLKGGDSSSGASSVAQIIPRLCIISNLQGAFGATFVGTNVTVTLNTNGVDSNLAFSTGTAYNSSTIFFSNTTVSVTCPAGTYAAWKLSHNAGTAVNVRPHLSWTECYLTP